MKHLIPILVVVFTLALLFLVACGSGSGGGETNAAAGESGEASTMTSKPAVGEGATSSNTSSVAAAEQSKGEKAVVEFSSFDGGGHEYSVEIEDPSVLSCTEKRDYGPPRDEPEDGSPFRMIFTFTGLKPGTTTVSVYGRSPIMENDDSIYTAVVDEDLNVTLEPVRMISTFFMSRNADIFYNTYRVSHWEDGYHVSVNDGDEMYIDAESVGALVDVIDKYDVEKWDGFSESKRHVLDGESFWLEVGLTDGTSIRAVGENVFPENYGAAISEMQEILDNAEVSGEPFQ